MKYQILVIDPPWKQQKILRKCRPNQKKEFDYKTISLQENFDLIDKLIKEYTDNDHCIFMWTIEKYLFDCLNLMFKRNYKKHCIFIWDKTNGIAPNFTIRYSHEYLIWFYKEKLLKINVNQRGKFKTTFIEKSRQHSRKPDYAYEMINLLYPEFNKIDIFSREKRLHFDQFGDEINYFN